MGLPRSIIWRNHVKWKRIVYGKYCFAGLILGNKVLSRERLHPNEHFLEIIGSLSLGAEPISAAVAFDRLVKTLNTLPKGVTPENRTSTKFAATRFLAYVVRKERNHIHHLLKTTNAIVSI